MTLLGIDIGTTHIKARAYDGAGRLLADARRPPRRGGSRAGAQSTLWAQLKADVSNLPVR